MICARCQTENRGDKYFCKNCGFALQGHGRRRAWVIASPPPSPLPGPSSPTTIQTASRQPEAGSAPAWRMAALAGVVAGALTLGVLVALVEVIRRMRASFETPGVVAFVEANPLDTAATWVYHNPTLSYLIVVVIALAVAGLFVELWR